MKKLTLLLLGLAPACATQQTVPENPVCQRNNVQKSYGRQPYISPFSLMGVSRQIEKTVNVEYDKYHFRIETQSGKFEHAEESYGPGKKRLCIESLYMKPVHIFSRWEKVVAYDMDCDSRVDLLYINSSEFKRPEIAMAQNDYAHASLFLYADKILDSFRNNYKTGRIREEWITDMDLCHAKCSFGFDIEKGVKK